MDNFPVDALAMPRYDPSDPEQVAQAEGIVDLRTREQVEVVRSLLSTYEGRAFFWMLSQEAGTARGIFAGEAPMTMSRNEGRREIGEWCQNWVFTAAPETYIMLRREAFQREQRYASLVGLDTESNEE